MRLGSVVPYFVKGKKSKEHDSVEAAEGEGEVEEGEEEKPRED